MGETAQRWAAPLPPRPGDRLRALAAPVLLAAIASLGVARAVTLDQSSWQGASFGMFATYDNDVSRIVRVYVEGPGGSVRSILPASLKDDATRLRVTPTESAAAALARQTLAVVRHDGATDVLVEVWRIHLDDLDGVLHLRTELLASARAEHR